MAQLVPPKPLRSPRPLAVRRPSSPPIWREIALVVAFYAAYMLVRLLIPHDDSAAYVHAGQIMRAEHAMGIDIELGLDHGLLRAPSLARLANLYYATAHFAVTLTVLVWLYRRRPALYARMRTALMLATATALAGFWLYPLAPPRFLGGRGFVDPVIALHSFGLYSSPEAGAFTNQFAAMPSMHAGWALWCAVALATATRRPLPRALAVLYPALTVLVILATANHYVVDAIAGMAITVAALVGAAILHKGRRADGEEDHETTKLTTTEDDPSERV